MVRDSVDLMSGKLALRGRAVDLHPMAGVYSGGWGVPARVSLEG